MENNINEFEKEALRQIKGTAMGPNNACPYAGTAIDKLDREVLEGERGYVPILWARFRNDVYVGTLAIWPGRNRVPCMVRNASSHMP